ncbi:VWA domain-containing protein [Virgibacillus kekensis]|uniref:VWA domain-containing protein n=1 Tax=Virgibacillus kekensis TaxID=202261 RepID=A0ABV9DDE5_9BACI
MKNNVTEIIFLLDRSGSMSGLENDTIGGFNSFIEKQCKLDGETVLTTALFDHDYELLWNGVDANHVKLTDKEYHVRGTTALLDAVGKTILDVGYRLSRTSANYRPDHVMFVITTDGMENSSREFTYEKVKELIKHQQKKYDWEFIFMGANIDAAEEADSIGIAREKAFNFEASTEGVEVMYDMVAEAVTESRKKIE